MSTTSTARPTTEQVTAAIRAMSAVADAVREFGPTGVPSGNLYAAVSSLMSLTTYNSLIQRLIEVGVVRLSNNVLYCVEVQARG